MQVVLAHLVIGAVILRACALSSKTVGMDEKQLQFELRRRLLVQVSNEGERFQALDSGVGGI